MTSVEEKIRLYVSNNIQLRDLPKEKVISIMLVEGALTQEEAQTWIKNLEESAKQTETRPSGNHTSSYDNTVFSGKISGDSSNMGLCVQKNTLEPTDTYVVAVQDNTVVSNPVLEKLRQEENDYETHFSNGVSAQKTRAAVSVQKQQAQNPPEQVAPPEPADSEEMIELTKDDLGADINATTELYYSTTGNMGCVEKGYDALKNWKRENPNTMVDWLVAPPLAVVKSLIDGNLGTDNVGRLVLREQQGLALMRLASEGELTKREYYELKDLMLLSNTQKILDGKIPGLSSEVLHRSLQNALYDIYFEEDGTTRRPLEAVMQDISEFETLLDNVDLNDTETSAAINDLMNNNFMQKLQKNASQARFDAQEPKIYQTTDGPNLTPNFPVKKAKGPEDISQLHSAQNSAEEIITFEEVFRIERAVAFKPENIDAYKQSKIELSLALLAYNKVNKFKQDAKNILYAEQVFTEQNHGRMRANYSQSSKSNAAADLFTDYYGSSALAADAMTRGIEELGYKDFVQAEMDENGKVELTFKENMSAHLRNNFLSELLSFETAKHDIYLDNFLDINKIKTSEDYTEIMSELLKTKGYEQETDDRQKALDYCQKKYERTYKTAFGDSHVKKIVEQMRDDNYSVVDNVSTFLMGTEMTVMAVGGILVFTGFGSGVGATMCSVGSKALTATMAVKDAAKLGNAYTKAKTDEEEIFAAWKETAMDIGILGVGMGAGKVGAAIQNKSLKKLESVLFKEGSKTAEVISIGAGRVSDVGCFVLANTVMSGDLHVSLNDAAIFCAGLGHARVNSRNNAFRKHAKEQLGQTDNPKFDAAWKTEKGKAAIQQQYMEKYLSGGINIGDIPATLRTTVRNLAKQYNPEHIREGVDETNNPAETNVKPQESTVDTGKDGNVADKGNSAVTKATEADLREVHKIDLEAFKDTDPAAADFGQFKAQIEADGLTTYVVKNKEGKVTGYFQIEPITSYGELYINSIGVPKELRNTRASYDALKQIQEHITQIAKDHNLKKAALHVDAENKVLVKMYEKYGFEIKTTEPGYFENGNDAHYMELDVKKQLAKLEQQKQKVKIEAEPEAKPEVKPETAAKQEAAEKLLRKYEALANESPTIKSAEPDFKAVVEEYKNNPEILDAIDKIMKNDPENINRLGALNFAKENNIAMERLPEILKLVPDIKFDETFQLLVLSPNHFEGAKNLGILKPVAEGRVNGRDIAVIENQTPEQQKYIARVLNTPICKSISLEDLVNYKWQDLNLDVLSKLEYTPEPHERSTDTFKNLKYKEFSSLTEAQIAKINERGLLKLKYEHKNKKYDASDIKQLANIDEPTWNTIQPRDLLNIDIPNISIKETNGETYDSQGTAKSRKLNVDEAIEFAKLDDAQYAKALSLLNRDVSGFGNEISPLDIAEMAKLGTESYNAVRKRSLLNGKDNIFNTVLRGDAIVVLAKMSESQYKEFADLYKYVQDNRVKLTNSEGDMMTEDAVKNLLLSPKGIMAYKVLGPKAIKHSMGGKVKGFEEVVHYIGKDLHSIKSEELLSLLKANLEQLPHPEQQISKAGVVAGIGNTVSKAELTEIINLIKPPQMTKSQVHLAEDIFSNGKSYDRQIEQFITEFNVPANKQPQIRKFLEEARLNDKFVKQSSAAEQIAALEQKIDYARSNDKIPPDQKAGYIKQFESQIQQIKDNPVEFTRARINDKALKALAQQVEAHINLDNYTKAFNDKTYSAMYKKLGVETTPELLSNLKFDTKYFAILFRGLNDTDFKANFEELIVLIKENPGKELSEIRELIPENQQTRLLFRENGLDYDKWISFDNSSRHHFEYEIKAADVIKAVGDNLRLELTDTDFSSIGHDVYASLKNKFEQAGLYKELALMNPTITSLKNPATYKQLTKIIEILESEIAENPVFKTDNRAAALFKDHVKLHKKNIHDIKDVKDRKDAASVRLSNDDNVGRNIFLGNHVGCCTSVGGSNSFAAPQHLMNSFVRAVEIVDKGGNSLGNSMCYFAKVDGKLTFIIDSFEANGKLGAAPEVTNAIINYAKQVCAEMGQPNANVMFGPNYNKINLGVRSALTENHTIEVIGRAPENTYIDAVGGKADINIAHRDRDMYEIMDL
ncbi:MAG: GNAT family N-acetyltransferase [Heliobacteriaceae bacterium]|nr:GNAT family N-acetyltransferase [Heliobacteriaceae bacterium]